MGSLVVLMICLTLLITGVTWLKIHPIPVLLVIGLILGLAMGNTVEEVTNSLLNGFGTTLKWIGLVILFGTLLGEILAETGGADLIADSIIRLFGVKFLPISLAVIGFLVGIPVFVDVAYLTLLPTIIALSKKSGHSVLVLGLSLAISLSVAHALIPPTPGPLAVAALLEIEIGEIIPLNVLVAISAVIGGMIWIKLNKKRLIVPIASNESISQNNEHGLKGFYKALPFISLLAPLVLMSIGALLSSNFAIIDFVKNPVWAIMIGVMLALPLIRKENFSKKLNDFFKSAGEKSASVILITGAGGAFGQVIKDSQIIDSLLSQNADFASLGILIPFMLSFLFTSVTGSITVSLITTSSIVAPMVTTGVLDPTITAAAIGAGSLGVIHVNSSFFWLFKEIHNVPTIKLLKSFSLLTGIIAVSGGIMVFLIYHLI